MSEKSAIEWTDGTWNLTTGCTRISEGCRFCYIDRTPPFRINHRSFDGEEIGATTGVLLHPERLGLPLKWKKPKRIFVNSLSDLFHDDIPRSLVLDAFVVMALARHHQFQVLTKRPRRMLQLVKAAETYVRMHAPLAAEKFGVELPLPWKWPLPNVWLGTSVEDQKAANLRVPLLLDAPATVHFLSCEPLLGPVELKNEWLELELQAFGGNGVATFPRVDWVIVGGESGPNARAMHPGWAGSLRDQCVSAEVPFFFKQWGAWRPYSEGDPPETGVLWDGVADEDSLVSMVFVGKKRAGRELDGRTWDEMPREAPL